MLSPNASSAHTCWPAYPRAMRDDRAWPCLRAKLQIVLGSPSQTCLRNRASPVRSHHLSGSNRTGQRLKGELRHLLIFRFFLRQHEQSVNRTGVTASQSHIYRKKRSNRFCDVSCQEADNDCDQNHIDGDGQLSNQGKVGGD